MKIIDFRFRPNTPEIINGIKNSSMFKATCEAIGFDKRVPQALPEIVADLDRRGVELCVVSGRDCETTYGFPANNNSILEFCRAYPNKFLGFWGIDPHKGMDAVREVEHVIKTSVCAVSPPTPISPTARRATPATIPSMPSASNSACRSS